ncbi:hypothetical protein [Marinobacterium sp. BA1]|uniref:hypothetical protein n=1 Tax=Marinobacterium sp. BA1 TaxID=3138931 RepID=UPI0032E69F5F
MNYTHAKGKGHGKYNGMKRAADWVGHQVKATRQIETNGGNAVSSGMQGEVTGAFSGLNVTFDVCNCCGTKTHVTKLDYEAVELCASESQLTEDDSSIPDFSHQPAALAMRNTIQPCSFIPMILEAESIEAVEHIYGSVDHLFGFEYSPVVHNEQQEWLAFSEAKESRIAQLNK